MRYGTTATTLGRCQMRVSAEPRWSLLPCQMLSPRHCFAPQPRDELSKEPAETFKVRGEGAARRKEPKALWSLENDR